MTSKPCLAASSVMTSLDDGEEGVGEGDAGGGDGAFALRGGWCRASFVRGLATGGEGDGEAENQEAFEHGGRIAVSLEGCKQGRSHRPAGRILLVLLLLLVLERMTHDEFSSRRRSRRRSRIIWNEHPLPPCP